MGTKISALPESGSAALTDVFPVVQSGITKKESNQQLLDLFSSIFDDAYAEKGVNSDITSILGITGNINFDSTLGTNLTASGSIADFTVGETMTFGQPSYFGSAGKMLKSDAEFGGPLATHLCLGSYASDAVGTFLKLGFIRNDSWSWTVGGTIYLSTTATLTQTVPASSTDAQQILGTAISSNIVFFYPNSIYFTQLGGILSRIANAGAARIALAAAANGSNSDITSLSGITGTININGSPATLNASGTIFSLNAAETVAFGQIGYITTSGTIGKADATDASKYPSICLILGSATIGTPVNVLTFGIVTLSSWTWTPGSVNPIYLSTAGAMIQTAPSGTDNCIQRIATPIRATTILFNPSADYLTHV